MEVAEIARPPASPVRSFPHGGLTLGPTLSLTLGLTLGLTLV